LCNPKKCVNKIRNTIMDFYFYTGFFLFWVLCYTLREIPHIWSKSSTYRLKLSWMQNSKWWTDASPRENRSMYNVIFADAYHFFGNLPRIAGILMLAFLVSWSYLFLFLIWYVGWLAFRFLILERVKK